MGKKVKTLTLSSDASYMQCNMYDVQDGVYTYEVVQNGSKLKSGTITILK
jgi:hypothetical protein